MGLRPYYSDGFSILSNLAKPGDIEESEVGDVLLHQAISEHMSAHPIKASLSKHGPNKGVLRYEGRNLFQDDFVDMRRTSDDPKLDVFAEARWVVRTSSDAAYCAITKLPWKSPLCSQLLPFVSP